MPKVLELFRETGLRWLWLSLLAFALDQITKQWVIRVFDLYESVSVIPMFNLTYVRNYGAAFSFLSDAGGWQRWFFTTIAIVVSVVLLVWLRKAKKNEVLEPVAFALILGGALGNVTDRLIYGYVIDFLDFYYKSAHYPAFNIADSAIFLGAACLIYGAFFHKENANSDNPDKSQANKNA